ncbi:type VII secretion-associated protein [Mycobacterium sp. MMS18-G62]
MDGTVLIEVGPVTIHGPNHPDPEHVTGAIECIDDDIGWVGDHPVATAELWRDVMYETAGSGADSLVLVCPTWWPSSWVDVVRDAALTLGMTVVTMSRAEALGDSASTVVEIADELVVVARCGEELDAVPRGGDIDADAAAVADRIPQSSAVLVDIPEDVGGGGPLAEAIANRLRAKGVAVNMADRRLLRHAAEVWDTSEDAESESPDAGVAGHRSYRVVAVLTGTVLSAAALCGGFAVNGVARSPTADDIPMTLLVEGRVSVKVPAQWRVQRITAGPGSARVQVVSPSDADVAVHITQSTLAPSQTAEMIVESLRKALGEQPAGVFVDFDPAARYADKPAATYREIRQDRHISWTVLVDKTLRIAIGCQTAPGRERLVREVCDRAIDSAHAVF